MPIGDRRSRCPCGSISAPLPKGAAAGDQTSTGKHELRCRPPPQLHTTPPPLLPTEPLQIPPQTSARGAELTPKLFPALFYPSYQPPPLSLPFPTPPPPSLSFALGISSGAFSRLPGAICAPPLPPPALLSALCCIATLQKSAIRGPFGFTLYFFFFLIYFYRIYFSQIWIREGGEGEEERGGGRKRGGNNGISPPCRGLRWKHDKNQTRVHRSAQLRSRSAFCFSLPRWGRKSTPLPLLNVTPHPPNQGLPIRI